jgi:hypothetical protein
VFPEQLKERILAYGQVRENLLLHAHGYPTTDDLLEKLHPGYPKSTGEGFNTAFGRRNYDPIDYYIGPGKDSDGSQCILNAVAKDDPRPVWMLVWGGSLDLAQALWRLRETYSESKFAQLISRIRVYAVSDQDATGPWIREQFPDVFYVRSSLGRLGSHAGMYSEGDTTFVREQWVKPHIQENHGPLGELYPKANPYGKEGDTPAFLYLIPNGLSDSNHPEYGGWGGRFFKYGSHFFDAEDEHPESDEIGPRRKWCVARWRRAYQHDFQARMDWCIQPFDQANHNPVAIIHGDTSRRIMNIRAFESDTLPLSAAGSHDPDGDELSYHWFVYKEAGTFTGDVTLQHPNAMDAAVVIPNHVAN